MDTMTMLIVIFVAAMAGVGLIGLFREANEAVALLREIRDLLRQGVSYGKT